MQGVRGATTVNQDNSIEIVEAVAKLLTTMLEENDIKTEDIGAALFSATKDITATFPAAAARTLEGWDLVPLFDAQQLYIENSLPQCIRVLLLVNTEKSQKELKHIYQGKAITLRPDLVNHG